MELEVLLRFPCRQVVSAGKAKVALELSTQPPSNQLPCAHDWNMTLALAAWIVGYSSASRLTNTYVINLGK